MATFLRLSRPIKERKHWAKLGGIAMMIVWRVALSILVLIYPSVTYASEQEDPSRSLEMQCRYADHKATQLESVSVRQGAAGPASDAAIYVFTRNRSQPQGVAFNVKPGQFAACVFPSGRRVRVKVGEGTARRYGRCGGNLEVFTSIWVDKRKVISRQWFAGHCRELSDPSRFSFEVSAQKVTRCSSAPDAAGGNPSRPPRTTKSKTAIVRSCADIPGVSRLPVDIVEYPRPGARVARAGTIEIVRGDRPVCALVADTLNADSLMGRSGTAPSLLRPEQRASSVALPDQLADGTESVFDFDNDGTLDRVIYRAFETTYMHGSVVLVQPGASRETLQVADSVLSPESIVLPCQLDDKNYTANDCPPFSQTGDEAGFVMKFGPHETSVRFGGRYAEVTPFRFQDATYVDVTSHSEDTPFVAVLKPLPNRQFQQLCLIRTVPENF